MIDAILTALAVLGGIGCLVTIMLLVGLMVAVWRDSRDA